MCCCGMVFARGDDRETGCGIAQARSCSKATAWFAKLSKNDYIPGVYRTARRLVAAIPPAQRCAT
jgi:hypothetical protein